MICVFDVIDGPARGKRFWLRANQRMAVGRISTADFAVPADAHMSRHHLILEANCEVVRLRDVGSANGTYVNESRINSLELHAGDKIRAGATILELSVLGDHEDPHTRDGLNLATYSGRAATGHQTVQGPVAREGHSIQAAMKTITGAAEEVSGDLPQPGLVPISTRVVRLVAPDTAAESPANVQQHDNEPTLRLQVQWWMSYFQATDTPGFYESRSTSGQGPSLVEVLRCAPAAKPIALVVNQSQLGRHGREALREVDSRLFTPLSHALLLVRFDASEAVWEFVGQSLQVDAVTCIGARKSFKSPWINELLDQLSYPSMLASLLKAENRSLKSRLEKHAAFALFERNRAGDLGLYLNEECLKVPVLGQ